MPAGADPIADRERAARTACLAGDYAKGVALLAELFVDTHEPTYIFNQGRCFEQNGRYEEAITRFHEFQQKNQDAGEPPDPNTEKHIATCQARIAQAVGQASAARIPDHAPAPSVPPTEAIRSSPRAASGDSRLRVATIATFAAGGAGLLTGLLLNLQANRLADELQSTTDNYQRSKESQRASYETYGWIGYGVGATCVAAGTILYFIGRSQGNDSSVALLPTVAPGAAGLALQGAY